MRVAVCGATGTIGRRLARALVARGDEVVPVSRGSGDLDGTPLVTWDPLAQPLPPAATEGVDAVVNLAGAPIEGGRWTEGRKRLIRESRVGTTRRIAEALAGGAGPRVLVNGSAVGFYGDRMDEELDESSPPGTGFLPEVCRAWEDAAREAERGGVRVAMARTGIVLAHEGGALPRLVTVTRLFAGGPVAGGRQWMPWVAMEDQVGMLLAALDDDGYRGPFNVTSPNPVRQREFADALGRVLGRPTLLPAPGFAVRVLLGEMADIVLDGQRALPRVAQAKGYAFRFTDVEEALRAELGRPRAAAA